MSNKSNIEIIKDYISKNYNLRYNVISNQFEYCKKIQFEKNKNFDKTLQLFEFKEITMIINWENLNTDNILIDLLSNHFKISYKTLNDLIENVKIQTTSDKKYITEISLNKYLGNE